MLSGRTLRLPCSESCSFCAGSLSDPPSMYNKDKEVGTGHQRPSRMM